MTIALTTVVEFFSDFVRMQVEPRLLSPRRCAAQFECLAEAPRWKSAGRFPPSVGQRSPKTDCMRWTSSGKEKGRGSAMSPKSFGDGMLLHRERRFLALLIKGKVLLIFVMSTPGRAHYKGVLWKLWNSYVGECLRSLAFLGSTGAITVL